MEIPGDKINKDETIIFKIKENNNDKENKKAADINYNEEKSVSEGAEKNINEKELIPKKRKSFSKKE